MARYLHPDQPFYALQPAGLDGRRSPFKRIEDLAAYFVDQLRTVQPEGPYLLGGYCSGGTAAFELAQQLRHQGQEVALLALFGSACPTTFPPLYRHLLIRAGDHGRRLGPLNAGEQASYMQTRVKTFLTAIAPYRSVSKNRFVGLVAAASRKIRLEAVTVSALRNYSPRPYPGRITLFMPSEEWRRSEDRPMDWAAFGEGGLDVLAGPDGCDGDVMLREPWVRWFAERLEDNLQRVDSRLSAARSRA